MPRSTLSLAVSLCMVLAAACTDAVAPSASPTGAVAHGDRAALLNPFRDTKLVAIGTSISMRWQSDRVYEATPAVAWPALLEFGTLRLMSLRNAGDGMPIDSAVALAMARRVAAENAGARVGPFGLPSA